MKYQSKAPFPTTGMMQTLEAVRLERSGACLAEKCQVAVEDAVSIDIKGVGVYTLMCTPSDAIALAVGFALTEGIIRVVEDIASLSECVDSFGVIRLVLKNPSTLNLGGRNLIVNSSCGLCGSKETVEALLSNTPPVLTTRSASLDAVLAAIENMRGRQRLFQHTGGAHAAALFDPSATLVALAEDVGRHNALDKAIGQCLLGGIPTAACMATLSGRLSLEMVMKAARAGVEIVVGVSAASSLAIRAAERLNVTICGFARESRMTVFAHAERILGPTGSATRGAD